MPKQALARSDTVELNHTAKQAAHVIAIGLASNLREAAEKVGKSPRTLYSYLSKDPQLRELFQHAIQQHRERRADKSSQLLAKAELIATRSLDKANNDERLDVVTGMQVAAMGTKVATDIRTALGEQAFAEPASESVQALASRIRSAVIHAITLALANPERAQRTAERLMKLESRARQAQRRAG